MESSNFWKELFKQLDFPFDVEEVKTIESNCGTTWIELNSGETYYMTIAKCEQAA